MLPLPYLCDKGIFASTNKTTIAMNKLLAIVLSINENWVEVQYTRSMGHSRRLTFEDNRWGKKIGVSEGIVVPPHPILKNV